MESVCSSRGLFISSLEWVQTSPCLRLVYPHYHDGTLLGILTDVHYEVFTLWTVRTQMILSLMWISSYLSPLVLFPTIRDFPFIYLYASGCQRFKGIPLQISISLSVQLLLCYYASQVLAALASLDSNLYLLNSARLQGFILVLPPCRAWSLWQ